VTTPRTRSGTQGGADEEWRKIGKSIPKNLLTTHPRMLCASGTRLASEAPAQEEASDNAQRKIDQNYAQMGLENTP